MSNITPGGQTNCCCGKSTGSHPRADDGYGNQPENRQGNAFRHGDISSGPPPWLKSYLENFRKKLIVELTDNIVRTLDSSYRNSAKLRKRRSNYCALKKRLAELEAERNNDKLQPENIQQPVAYTAINNECGEKKLPDELHSLYEANCDDESKHLIEPVLSSSKTASPEMMNISSETIVQLPSAPEYSKNLVYDNMGVTHDVMPSNLSRYFQNYQGNEATRIVHDAKDDMELSPIRTNETADNSNQCIRTEIECCLKEIFNLLRETKSNEETLSTDQPGKVNENIEIDKNNIDKAAEVDKTLDEGNQITRMMFTSENYDSVIKIIRKNNLNLLRDQFHVIKIICDQVFKDSYNASVYARLLNELATILNCTNSCINFVSNRCTAELQNYENNQPKIVEMGEQGKSIEEIAEKIRWKYYGFTGFVIFTRELHERKLLKQDVFDEYHKAFSDLGPNHCMNLLFNASYYGQF